MLNSADLLLTEIFYLLTPAIIILLAVLLVSIFYVRRIKKVFRRYKLQKLEEVENERKRIANDLHDFVASKLIKIKSELNESLGKSNEPVVHRNIAQGIDDLNKFHNDLRYLVEYIYPKELVEGNLVKSFKQLAEEMSNSNTEIIMDIEFENSLTKTQMHQLYRLLQEKISNLIAHANPPKIFIGLFENIEDKEVLLSLSYLPKVKETSKFMPSFSLKSGRGMAIIQDRLSLLNAKYHSEIIDGFVNETIVFPI